MYNDYFEDNLESKQYILRESLIANLKKNHNLFMFETVS